MKIYHTKTQEDYDALAEWINTKIKECEENVESIMNKNIFERFQNRSYLEYSRGKIDAFKIVLLQIRLRKMTRWPQTITENIDNVNNPPHYTQGEFEVIDILKDKLTKEEFEGFLKGNILKYTFRENIKNGTEDMKKAAWYTSKLIEFREASK